MYYYFLFINFFKERPLNLEVYLYNNDNETEYRREQSVRGLKIKSDYKKDKTNTNQHLTKLQIT